MLLLTSLAFAAPSTESLLNDPDRPYQISLHAEVGALAVFSHRIQFGQDGSVVDYIDDGGQDTLFPVARISSEVLLNDRHSLVLLYQPLVIGTSNVVDRDLTLDGVVFPAGTPIDFTYGFSFWRGSYLYDLAPSPNTEIGVGASLQIRNARLTTSSSDGTLFHQENDIGPVPVLKVRGRHVLNNGMFFGAEIDGFYAPIKYINGSNTDVVGAIVDSSVRGGWQVANGAEVFVNLRYLGGGASGTSKDPEFGDGYTDNWLHFGTVSVGMSLR
jgi:hypothetical protein